MPLNRRGFLIGLFGAAAIAKAGPIPKALQALSDTEFKQTILAAMPRADEIYGLGGEYYLPQVNWTNEPPFIRITIPAGARPLREESDRIGAEAIARMLKEFNRG
jgi:hypothetical protein